VINKSIFTYITIKNVFLGKKNIQREYCYLQSKSKNTNTASQPKITTGNAVWWKMKKIGYNARSNKILGWEGVGNRGLLCFFKAWINWSMLTDRT
jgi:hypothetical protein